MAPDLPAHGQDGRAPWRATLAAYSQQIQSVVASCNEPVIAVGHSMGGMAISQAVSDRPESFRAAAYLCAFAPLPGDSLASLALKDRASQIPASIRPGLQGVRIRPERAREVFYADCSSDAAERAVGRLRPDPYRPLFNRYRAVAAFPVPRFYIACEDDRAISRERQYAMAERAKIPVIASLKTGHSPFLSAPNAVVKTLLDVATS